jgi:hypothetical protein
LDKGFGDSTSDAIREFIENIIETDQGFGQLPYDVLEQFAQNIQQEYGTLPHPSDSIWEQVMDLASISLIDDPDSYVFGEDS